MACMRTRPHGSFLTKNGATRDSLTAVIAVPTVTGSAATTAAAPAFVLSPFVKFTVGLPSAVGSAAACAGPPIAMPFVRRALPLPTCPVRRSFPLPDRLTVLRWSCIPRIQRVIPSSRLSPSIPQPQWSRPTTGERICAHRQVYWCYWSLTRKASVWRW